MKTSSQIPRKYSKKFYVAVAVVLSIVFAGVVIVAKPVIDEQRAKASVNKESSWTPQSVSPKVAEPVPVVTPQAPAPVPKEDVIPKQPVAMESDDPWSKLKVEKK